MLPPDPRCISLSLSLSLPLLHPLFSLSSLSSLLSLIFLLSLLSLIFRVIFRVIFLLLSQLSHSGSGTRHACRSCRSPVGSARWKSHQRQVRRVDVEVCLGDVLRLHHGFRQHGCEALPVEGQPRWKQFYQHILELHGTHGREKVRQSVSSS